MHCCSKDNSWRLFCHSQRDPWLPSLGPNFLFWSTHRTLKEIKKRYTGRILPVIPFKTFFPFGKERHNCSNLNSMRRRLFILARSIPAIMICKAGGISSVKEVCWCLTGDSSRTTFASRSIVAGLSLKTVQLDPGRCSSASSGMVECLLTSSWSAMEARKSIWCNA